MALKKRSRSGAGLGVDFTGSASVDPTENVKALSEALSQRQDDLRDLNNKYLDARLNAMEKQALDQAGHLKEIQALQASVSLLRAEHTKEMRESESKRLDAIRATDVAAVSTTAAQSLAAIQTLASTATATAETLRNQVANAATTIANQTDRIVSPILERLAALEKTSNIGQGRSTVADPQIAELVQEMRRLGKSGDVNAGKAEGISLSAAVTMGLVSLVLGLLGIGSALYAMLKP